MRRALKLAMAIKGAMAARAALDGPVLMIGGLAVTIGGAEITIEGDV